MQLRSKYYTYPVIIEGGDFYSDSSFETDAEKEMVGYDIKFILTAKLVNPQLEDMLKSNKVSIIHHIECPQTCLRTIVKTNEERVEKLIPDADVNGIVQICSFLVANEDLPKYSNDYFSQDYRGFKFDIEKGCVLAIGNQINFWINKVRDDLANTSSIFSIMPNLDATVLHMQVDLTGDKIAILLPEVAFGMYKNMSSLIDMQQAMHQMIIIPALMYVFSELKSAKDQLYVYEDQRWFRNLRKSCEKIGYSINEECLENLDIVMLSQLILDNPLIGGLKAFTGTEEYYED